MTDNELDEIRETAADAAMAVEAAKDVQDAVNTRFDHALFGNARDGALKDITVIKTRQDVFLVVLSFAAALLAAIVTMLALILNYLLAHGAP